MFSQAGISGAGEPIGDALALLAKQPSNHALAAIVLLRCFAIRGLVPEPNSTNNIIRSTVALCGEALPDIADFLKIDKCSQNYEKFAVWSGCHHRITEILSPLLSPYGDLDALLSAHRGILGCLNHSIVRKYAAPYRLAEIRATIESLLGKLKKVSSLSPTLLVDIEECNRVVQSMREELRISNSFLKQDFLALFLQTSEAILSKFLDSLRGRFAATITWGGGSGNELQKRYPLHEPGRVIQIVVPLRNSGPGMATDVRITGSATGKDVALGGETIMLGNMLPGDFSVALDATVLSPCSDFEELLSVEWGEIGNPMRQEMLFDFRVIAQSSTVDWQSLEYRTPYRTDVAEGDEFVGRTDKIRFLAAKLLRHPMEPFYLTGQKRVGKTSLALAAAQFAKATRAFSS